MMHKVWCSIEEVPYYFLGSSIKFRGHTGWKIDNLNRIWVRLLAGCSYQISQICLVNLAVVNCNLHYISVINKLFVIHYCKNMHNDGLEWVEYKCSIPHHCGGLYEENMISKTTKSCKSLVWYFMILQAPQQQFKSSIALMARHFHIS